MKPLPGNQQLGLASPLQYAAIQSGKTKNPSTKGTGLDVKPPAGLQRGEGKSFFLDILFYRMSEKMRLVSRTHPLRVSGTTF